MILKSPAKLNLYLKVLRKRKDGYHDIISLFERIDLSDTISLKRRRANRIKIISASGEIPKDKTNLAWRAAGLLQRKFKIKQGVEIKITKRIPVGAGLGGGSGNAATVLMGLNRLWNLNLSKAKLAALAKEIGSDVAFFIHDCPFALAEGRGERIKPLKTLNQIKLWHVLAVPRVNVSTPFIYQQWDKAKKVGLTSPESDVKILTSALRKNALSLVGKALFNSLEEVTTRLYPALNSVKGDLAGLGLKAIRMTGSGPAIFGICSSRKEAVSISRQLAQNRSLRVFLSRTL